MLEDKSRKSFQGNHLFPVYDERCCGIAHLPPLLPERRRYNKHRGYAQQHHTDVRRRSGKVAYIFIQFLNNISRSLDESAFLDGASYFRIYRSIILPMLRPAIATVLVIKFVGIYNDFYTANLYMPSKELGVVSTALYRFIGPYGAKWEIIFAGIIICIIPSLIIFITLQKFIYSNLVAGSVKE